MLFYSQGTIDLFWVPQGLSLNDRGPTWPQPLGNIFKNIWKLPSQWEDAGREMELPPSSFHLSSLKTRSHFSEWLIHRPSLPVEAVPWLHSAQEIHLTSSPLPSSVTGRHTHAEEGDCFAFFSPRGKALTSTRISFYPLAQRGQS